MICPYCREIIVEKDYFTEEDQELNQLLCDCVGANKQDAIAKRELARRTNEYIKQELKK